MIKNPAKISTQTSDWIVARWMLIIRPTVITATLGVAILMLPPAKIDVTNILIVVVGTYILTLLYWIAQYFSKVSKPILITQIGFDIFIITVIIHYTGGYLSPFVGFYFLSIMCASLVFRRLVTYLFSTQSAVFYGFYIMGVGPSPDSSVKLDNSMILQVILYSTLMYAVGFFSSYYNEKLRGKDTALSNALKLLRKARLDTSDILQSMTTGLITFDMSGSILYMNRFAENILQIDRYRTVGKDHKKVFGDRAQELSTIVDEQLMSTSPELEREIEIVNNKRIQIPLGLRAVPLYDTDGSRRGVMVNFRDLTEKNKLLEMLRQSERMAAIGELSAAIAHEIRNPLASISNALELLSDTFEKRNPEVMKLLNIIEKESSRLQRISSDFLKFARMSSPNIQPVNLRKILDEMTTLVANDPRKTQDITIKNKVNGNVAVLFDIDQLKQLVINILINSLEALDGRGDIDIALEDHSYGTENYVRVIFNDSGPGFPEEAIGRMFEPFYSTKKEGTGLGLALVRKIAISNHGRVSAWNSDEGGAVVALDMLINGVQ
jgi:two-component system, NtrC family, sensor histidine kinase PilS